MMIKYPIHKVAKDFKKGSKELPSKEVMDILTQYGHPPKNHMQPLTDEELSIVFEYLTQHNEIDSIESVYAQTEQDFELIIVDNGSTDESLEQARSYCGRPNFTLIENGANTGGFSHAVNQGIARARGEYVVMFNNDAFAEPEWLAELHPRRRDRTPKSLPCRA